MQTLQGKIDRFALYVNTSLRGRNFCDGYCVLRCLSHERHNHLSRRTANLFGEEESHEGNDDYRTCNS